ncbi:MAG TPA: hypothetical protein VG845_10525 [Dehalococcoidia bacterium]|nr:hypothetical protein [Dehalococcoidia bacterium]
MIACSDDEPAPSVTPAPSATHTPTPPPTATIAPTSTPRPRPAAGEFPEDLKQQARDLLDRVAAARNSPPMRQVDMFLLTRPQVRAIYEQPTPGPTGTPPPPSVPPIDLKEETYVLLGLIPPPEETGRDLDALQLDNLIPLITGFYNHEFNAFYLVDGLNGGIYGGLARSTIVHEITHALQYQYRDIDAIARQRANDWDGTTALLDVLEGDAVHTENLVLGFSTRSTYRQPVCFTIPPPQRPGTAYAIERELDTWYEDGLCFVQAVSGRVLRGINGVFEDLPTTTEQILHPEKYLAGEDAQFVVMRGIDIGPGWQQLGRANFGEFGLQNLLLLGLLSDRPGVQAAAAGWGGDGFALYGNGDARLLYAETLWDSTEEATEFFNGLVTSLANRGSGQLPPQSPQSYTIALGGVTWRVYLNGDRVTFLVSTDAAAAESAAMTVERP